MIEVNVDASEVKWLAGLLEQSPQVIEAAKKKAIVVAAPKMKAIVDEEIGGTGKVRSWQGQYVGSKGLYAAVRPKKGIYIETKGRQKRFRAGPKKYAVGYVTNAINRGHLKPKNAWGYRTSAEMVAGKHFYEAAQAPAEQVGKEAAEQIVQTLIDHLEE